MVMPRKADSTHWLEGTKSRVTDKPSAFKGGRPRIPKHLGPVARKAYKRAVQLLENRRTLVPSDETTLELYACTYETWLQARLEIGTALMVTVEVADSNGHVRKVQKVHPLLKVMETSAARLTQLASKLGFDQISINRTKPTADSESERTADTLAAEEYTRPKVLSLVPPPLTFDDEEKQ
jgi:P27 family predicted phage terminase small subunit